MYTLILQFLHSKFNSIFYKLLKCPHIYLFVQYIKYSNSLEKHFFLYESVKEIHMTLHRKQ